MSELLTADIVDDVTVLEPSIVRKVAPVIGRRGDRDVPLIKNAFGLPAGISCPGRTEFCNSCYAENLETGWPNVGKKLRRNFDALTACDDDIDAMATLIDPMVTDMASQFKKYDIPDEESAIRWHWDGDFFSEEYAEATALVMEEHVNTTFWVYTRSFVEPVDVVSTLVRVPNLRLYLSADEFNNDVAQEIRKEYGKEKISIAYSTKRVEDARRLEGESGEARICPENVGRIALVSEAKPDGTMVGACVTCGICFRGKHQDIIFTTDHEFSRVQSLPFPPAEHLLKVRKKPEAIS